MNFKLLFEDRMDALEDLPDRPSIFWYPSAGHDFRGPVFLTDHHIDRLRMHHGKHFEKPDLFVYNCLGNEVPALKNRLRQEATLYNDGSTRVTGKNYKELTLQETCRTVINPNYINTESLNYTPDINTAFYFELHIEGVGEEEYTDTQKVLYFEYENIDFFNRIILSDIFDTKYLCTTREGCGWGDCLKSVIEYIYQEHSPEFFIEECFKPRYVIPFVDFTQGIFEKAGKDSNLFSYTKYWHKYIHEKYEKNTQSTEAIFRLDYH